MSATAFEQEREELNDEILQIKRTLQSMEDEERSEDEDDEDHDALCVDLEYDSGLAVEPVDREQETAAGLVSDDDQQASDTASSSTLPTSSTKTVLALNRAYQNVVRESLQRVELALDQNRERQMAMKEELEQDAKDKMNSCRKNPVTTFGVPFFKDINGMNPPLNEDALMKRDAKEGNPFVRPPKQWLSREKKKLKEAVKSDALRRHMRPLMNRKEVLLAKSTSLTHQEHIGTEIKQLDEDIEQIKCWSESRLLGSRTDTSGVDWLKISSVDFDGERSAPACELMWKNAVHPSINSSKWRTDEDDQLDKIVKRHGERDWTAIADELGTNRTPFQCLQRYQTRLNPCLATGKWTNDEDKFLLEVVESFCETDDVIPWSQVAECLEGRSQEQCSARWAKLKELEQTKSYTWSSKEDMKLIEAVQWFGAKSWSNVSKFVPGRTDVQCRERWINALDTNLKIGNWTYEEDRKIWLAVQEMGVGKWVKIASRLPGRTDNMVLHRYQRMKRHQDTEERLSKIPITKAARKNIPKVDATETKLICEDKAKGIIIPRPIKGVTCHLVKMLELRRSLHEKIKLRVQRGLALDTCSMPAQLDDMLESTEIPGVETVRSMLDTSRMLKKNLLKRDQVKVKHKGLVGTKGRPKSTAEERKVRLEIIELLQATKGKRRKGRPRKKQAEEVNVGAMNKAAGDNTCLDNSTETLTEVAEMFFKTLQVDVVGMSKRARKVRAQQGRGTHAPRSSSSWQPDAEGQRKSDLELWQAVAMGMTKTGASSDVGSCDAIEESGQRPRKKRPICTMAAIPPNTTTLTAFKSLLLRKCTLSATVDKDKTLQCKTIRTKSTKGGSIQQSCAVPSEGGSTNEVMTRQSYSVPPESGSINGVTTMQSCAMPLEGESTKGVMTEQSCAMPLEGGSTKEVTTQHSCVILSQGGSTSMDTMPDSSSGNVAVIDLHNNKMKVKDYIAVKKLVSTPPSCTAAAAEELKPESATDGQLKQIRQTRDYRLLRERMHAMFLWPALISAISLDTASAGDDTNLPSDLENNNLVQRKRKKRYPLSRGKKYRKYTLKRKEVKEVYREIMRKNVAKREQHRKHGRSPDPSVDAGESDMQGETQPLDEERGVGIATMKTESNEAAVEDGRRKIGRPKGGGKKRTWEAFGERQTRSRSQKNESSTQVVPKILGVVTEVPVKLSKLGTPPKGAVSAEIIPLPVNDHQRPLEADNVKPGVSDSDPNVQLVSVITGTSLSHPL